MSCSIPQNLQTDEDDIFFACIHPSRLVILKGTPKETKIKVTQQNPGLPLLNASLELIVL